MKFKTLRTIKEPKQFVYIDTIGDMMMMYEGDLPRAQPLTATLEAMKEYYANNKTLPGTLSFDDLELVEFEMFEADSVGADIRNKLTPVQNLLALLKIYFNESSDVIFEANKKANVLRLIKKEAEKCEDVVKYLDNLL